MPEGGKMRLVMHEKRALTNEIARRYRKASRKEKRSILDEFTRTTGYNRKYAIHILTHWGKTKLIRVNGKLVKLKAGPKEKTKRTGRVIYGEKVRACIIKIWEFFDFICGKRLAIIIRNNLEALAADKSFGIGRKIKPLVQRISPSTIDRILTPERKKNQIKGRSHTRSSGLLKHQIPIRTFADWNDKRPGFFEIDTVGHDGGLLGGEFCFTLTATDVLSGWVELRALKNKAHKWVHESIDDIRTNLPFLLLGIDSDNGGEFINHALVKYCEDNRITFTRARSYRKNDNCFVEQKNDVAVRKHVGYYRFNTDAELAALKEVYKHLCPLLNYYYPSVRLLEKIRDGVRVRKVYDEPKPPFQRLLESKLIDAETEERLRREYRNFRLVKQKRLLDASIEKLIRLYNDKKQGMLPL